MKGRKIKSFVVPVAYTLAICVFVFSIYLLEGIVNNKMFANNEDSNIQYVDSEIVNVNEYIPVVSEDKNIIRPYKGDNISISKKYYDYDKEEGPVWMFGIGIKKRGKKKKLPIYIKIYITKTEGASNYCISFHVAKFEMLFPYKTEL